MRRSALDAERLGSLWPGVLLPRSGAHRAGVLESTIPELAAVAGHGVAVLAEPTRLFEAGQCALAGTSHPQGDAGSKSHHGEKSLT